MHRGYPTDCLMLFLCGRRCSTSQIWCRMPGWPRRCAWPPGPADWTCDRMPSSSRCTAGDIRPHAEGQVNGRLHASALCWGGGAYWWSPVVLPASLTAAPSARMSTSPADSHMVLESKRSPTTASAPSACVGDEPLQRDLAGLREHVGELGHLAALELTAERLQSRGSSRRPRDDPERWPPMCYAQGKRIC